MIPLALSPKARIDSEIAELEGLTKDARIAGLIAAPDVNWFLLMVAKYKTDLASLFRSSKKNDVKACRTKTERLLKSSAAKIVAISRTARRGKYEGLPTYGLSQNALETHAKVLDMYRPLAGFASIVTLPVANGKIRPTLDFSGNVRAAQLIVSDILLAMQFRSSIDFNNAGRGVARAVRKICFNIEQGYFDWLSFDLKDYYPSINRKHTGWLPLPEEVIRACVFPNAYVEIEESEENKAVRRGLPQGAALSGIIASAMIERELQPLVEGDCWVGSYVDDVMIGARSLAGLSKVADAIKSRFNEHPAGPLHFKFFDIRNVSDGLNFAGYFIRDFGGDGKHDVHAYPNFASRERFRNRLADKLDTAQLFDFEARAALAEGYAARWLSNFSAMPLSASYLEDIRTEALIIAADWGTVAQIKHYPLLDHVGSD